MTSADRGAAADEPEFTDRAVTNDVSLALLHRAQAGETDALNELIETWRTYLLHLANREIDPALKQKLGASDLVQSACIDIQNRFADFRGETEAEWREWLKMLLVRDVQDARRRFQDTQKRDIARECRLNDSAGLKFDVATDDRSPRSEMIAAEESALLETAMGRLSAEHREVLQLRNWDELTFPQIGDRMKRSEEAARKLWARAVARLQTEVDKLSAGDFEERP